MISDNLPVYSPKSIKITMPGLLPVFLTKEQLLIPPMPRLLSMNLPHIGKVQSQLYISGHR